MLINSLFIYYFIAYLFIYYLVYSAFKKRLNSLFIIASNIIFGAGLIYCLNASLSIEKTVFLLSVLVGNFIITIQNLRFNDRLWALINVQLHLGILLLSLPNVLFSFLGLLLIIFSFGRSYDRKKEFILNSAVAIWMLVFCLLTASWSSDIGNLSLKTIINDYLILSGFLYFFLVYGLCRCFYEVSTLEAKDITSIKKIKNLSWLWIGVFCNYFILFINELEINKENFFEISSSSSFILIILLFIALIKIENVKSVYKYISYTIISQVSVLVLLVVSNVGISLSWLIYTNLCLLTFLLLDFEKENKNHSQLHLNLKFFSQVTFLLLLCALPFTPWFESNFIFVEHLKIDKSPILYIIGLGYIGIRYRQNFLQLLKIIREKSSKVSKAS